MAGKRGHPASARQVWRRSREHEHGLVPSWGSRWLILAPVGGPQGLLLIVLLLAAITLCS